MPLTIADLEKKKKEYDNVLSQLQQSVGEKKQIQADQIVLQQELEKAGFKNKTELEKAITDCENELIALQTNLDKFVVGTNAWDK